MLSKMGRDASRRERRRRSTRHVVVIGAGIGGLTAAALLLQEGYDVTVLEAHVYPGGSAGTFYHQGYRFDAGATLAGGFAAGGPHQRLGEMLSLSWPVHPVDPAWVVHLPGGLTVRQWADREAWKDERQHIFPGTEPFWQRQEMLAQIAWDLAQRPLPWPPASPRDLSTLARAVEPQMLRALPYLNRRVEDLIKLRHPAFKTFLDAQLLIAAQTTAQHTNALYGSAALDLPRRGVNHVRGGIGALAQTLAEWIRAHGGRILYRQQVKEIAVRRGMAVAAHTNKGLTVEGDWFIANVTPWSLLDLLGAAAPDSLRQELSGRAPTWGAFTLYLGLDARTLPPGAADHHQVIVDAKQPLGEGNSVFISLSDPEDGTRAPAGKRAATLSTHTRVEPWWRLRQGVDKDAYEKQRAAYTSRLLNAAEVAVPGIKEASELILPGTPVTFAFYTRRAQGMVGGFPQHSLFRARGPQTGIWNLRLVGDSVFPGQSTAGVTVGAMRVAGDVMAAMGRRSWPVPPMPSFPPATHGDQVPQQ